jgi:hypothetical protein
MKPALILLLIPLLIACNATKESRHQDLTRLEKPPGYEIKPAENNQEADQAAASGTSTEQGLFADVYRTEDKDTEIRIKRTLDESWVLVGKAILLNELEISGKNRKQGRYQVAYSSGGLLDGFSLFGSSKASTYLLKLDGSGNETIVSISKVEDDSDYDPSRLMDGTPDYSYDSSAKLTDLIFDTLYDKVRF